MPNDTIIYDARILRAMAKRSLIKFPADETDNRYVNSVDGVPAIFEYNRKHYTLRYIDGCFYPFVFLAAEPKKPEASVRAVIHQDEDTGEMKVSFVLAKSPSDALVVMGDHLEEKGVEDSVVGTLTPMQLRNIAVRLERFELTAKDKAPCFLSQEFVFSI